jgi:hypothetical protein
MKKVLICTLILGSLVALLAIAQDDTIDQKLAAIRLDVGNLGLRVDRLEAAAGASGGGGSANGPSVASASAARSMVLVSVHRTQPTEQDQQEIAQLQQQCEMLMNTVNSSADAAAGAIGTAISNNTATYASGGVSGWRGSVGGSERTAGGGFGVAQQAGDIETEQRYATLHAIKLKQLQALQDSANTPKQVLIGHNDRIIFTLYSKVDLTEALNNIPIGATISWTGNRLSAEDHSETWRIDSCTLVTGN